jgi:phage baseplate assembly protein W
MARDFLGIGWKFPLQVTPAGRIATAAYEQRIEESVFLILSTARGERVMLPEFGCGVHELTFSSNTPSVRSGIVDSVRSALVKHEPRIDVLEIETEAQGDNLLLIRINYRIRANNAVGNLVYPFYITEVA